jgi:hypothetical protein
MFYTELFTLTRVALLYTHVDTEDIIQLRKRGWVYGTTKHRD